MAIYDIPSIVNTAFPLAMTPSNINSGFRVIGVCPFNSNIFQDHEFPPSFVTDRPAPQTVNEIDELSELETAPTNGPPTPVCSTPASSRVQMLTPEEIRPFPKAGPRKQSNRGIFNVRAMQGMGHYSAVHS